jgi:hypothetical protein
VLRPRFLEAALGWASDHLEPGATLGHSDPSANEALQVFSCVGNQAIVVDGPAAGDLGRVIGKHGGVLVAFPPVTLRRLAPGERVAINARGVGLGITGEPDVVFHSCDPDLATRLLEPAEDGRMRVRVRAVMPPEAAGAGMGMLARQFNLDLQVSEGEPARIARDLHFGDIVAVLDQDHRFLRGPREGWLALGVIAHGQSIGGGHGLGLVTLVTGPSDRFILDQSPDASLASLLSSQDRWM